MSKVVYWMTVSLDGFVETRDGKIDWTAPDDELHRFLNESARKLGAFLQVQVLRDLPHALAYRRALAHQPHRLRFELLRERPTCSAHRHTFRLGLHAERLEVSTKPRQAHSRPLAVQPSAGASEAPAWPPSPPLDARRASALQLASADALDVHARQAHDSHMATVHQVIELAAQLSEEERRVVVDAIAPKESVEELAQAWGEEIARRAARVRSGDSKGRPADEVFDRIEAKLRAR